MKYTDEEYLEALNSLYELVSDLQSADQNVYHSELDLALDELSGRVYDEISVWELKFKIRELKK